jgi:hypothetical protein
MGAAGARLLLRQRAGRATARDGAAAADGPARAA